MPANRSEPGSVHFWFQSNKISASMARPNKSSLMQEHPRAYSRHAGDLRLWNQKGADPGSFLFAGMARSYNVYQAAAS